MEDLQRVSELLSMCKNSLNALVDLHNEGELRDVGPLIQALQNILDELDAEADPEI